MSSFGGYLVETGVLGGGREVRDGSGVRATLGDSGLGGVVGGVVVDVRDGVDQTVGVARAGHAHLLRRSTSRRQSQKQRSR